MEVEVEVEVDGEVEHGRGGFKAAKNAAWLWGEGWGRMWGDCSKPYLRGAGEMESEKRREEKRRRARPESEERRGKRGEESEERDRETERERISPSIRLLVNKNERLDRVLDFHTCEAIGSYQTMPKEPLRQNIDPAGS